MLLGVSVVICCHNSSQRLPPTLTHLAAQKVQDVQWEIIVVDNASSDTTSQVALDFWSVDTQVPLRVVYEPKLGLSYARDRGCLEAKYELISLIDDDNWVCPEWIQLVAETMSQNSQIGACGGANKAVCEVTPPDWFTQHQGCYAVGAQGYSAGDITVSRGQLWGAGLTVRKAAWQQLRNNGFRPILADRRGSALTAGGDSELCVALRMAGWRLWYEPRLVLHHYLPAQRLQWNYLRRLYQGFGVASVGYDTYYYALQSNPQNFKEKLRQTWLWQTTSILVSLLRKYKKLILLIYFPLEGDSEVLDIEHKTGRLFELLRNYTTFNLSIRQVKNAAWKQI